MKKLCKVWLLITEYECWFTCIYCCICYCNKICMIMWTESSSVNAVNSVHGKKNLLQFQRYRLFPILGDYFFFGAHCRADSQRQVVVCAEIAGRRQWQDTISSSTEACRRAPVSSVWRSLYPAEWLGAPSRQDSQHQDRDYWRERRFRRCGERRPAGTCFEWQPCHHYHPAVPWTRRSYLTSAVRQINPPQASSQAHFWSGSLAMEFLLV